MASLPRRPRRLRAVLLGLFLVASLAGCVSMPSGGPVTSYPITQGPNGQGQAYVQAFANPPQANWGPEDMVKGFLTASASLARQDVAREYLTSQEKHAWKPGWSAYVYKNGPSPGTAIVTGTGAKKTATVTVGGSVQAILYGNGGYAVRSSPAGALPGGPPITFTLQQVGGQWRISKAPPYLLLTSYQFQADYQLRNLFFFDPTNSMLVPDPVYVPSQGTTANLMDGLVNDLIHLPGDWLTKGAATNTAFPRGTRAIGDVTVNGGTAAVNLGGTIAKASYDVKQQVSAQLLYTLIGPGGSGPAVQSVELMMDGKPWSPLGSGPNPVQQLRQSKFSPQNGASSTYYYVDGTGNLLSTGPQGKAQKLGRIGTGYSQIAVSPDKGYLAAVSNGSLFVGRIGGRLVKWGGGDYNSISWDPNDNLWATSDGQIVMVRGTADPAQPQGAPIGVDVLDSDGTTQNITAVTNLRVAPDGVRVAIVLNGTDLHFGAIVEQSVRPGQMHIEIILSPFSVTVPGADFTSLAWYGAENVIALREPGSELTEYPVDGGSSTSIPAQPGMTWITASYGSALLAGLPKGAVVANPNLSVQWTKLPQTAASAAYPG